MRLAASRPRLTPTPAWRLTIHPQNRQIRDEIANTFVFTEYYQIVKNRVLIKESIPPDAHPMPHPAQKEEKGKFLDIW
jgi:hypothetical protein